MKQKIGQFKILGEHFGAFESKLESKMVQKGQWYYPQGACGFVPCKRTTNYFRICFMAYF